MHALLLLGLALGPAASRTAAHDPAAGERVRSYRDALDFLREVRPQEARVNESLGSLWRDAQSRALEHLLGEVSGEAKAGVHPAVVFDIHDTLEAVEVEGFDKNDPAIPAVPGGPTFLRQLLARGARVVILSNAGERYRDAETATLKRLGYPVDSPRLTLLLKPNAKEGKWDAETWKGKASVLIRGLGDHVLAVFDDKEGNLQAMHQAFPDALSLQMVLDGPHAKAGAKAELKLRDLRLLRSASTTTDGEVERPVPAR